MPFHTSVNIKPKEVQPKSGHIDMNGGIRVNHQNDFFAETFGEVDWFNVNIVDVKVMLHFIIDIFVIKKADGFEELSLLALIYYPNSRFSCAILRSIWQSQMTFTVCRGNCARR